MTIFLVIVIAVLIYLFFLYKNAKKKQKELRSKARKHFEDIKMTIDYWLKDKAEIIEFILSEKSSGREIVLATASPERYANSIAEELGLFDLVLSSTSNVNLKGTTKKDELVRRFGEKGFDYIGDSHADVSIGSGNTKFVIYLSSGYFLILDAFKPS